MFTVEFMLAELFNFVLQALLHHHINTAGCTAINGQEYSECASPCPATCSQPDPLCIAVCQPGCACPTGQVIHEESARCVLLEECSTQGCPPGKEYDECGTACPLTCDNYNVPLPCTDECVQGCFCSPGLVENGDQCIDPSDCQTGKLMLSSLPLV